VLSKPVVKLVAIVLAWVYRGYMALVWHTSRVESYGMARAVNAVNAHRNVVVALWHDNVVLAPRCCRDFRPTTLASRSDSGEIITAALRLQQYHVFRGGSSRGKSRRTPVLQQLVEYVKQREEVVLALTVDGSTGPARVLKPGVIALACDTGAPIFAIHIACRPTIRARSWDRTRIPLPFGRIVMVLEGPIIPKSKPIDGEEFRRLRDQTQLLLEDTANRAERYLAGESPPPPDPRLELDPSYGDRDLRKGRAILNPDEPPPNPRLRIPTQNNA
jgi:lysophospholipid acyltransferase (LPLAT)-like uncharacterized protein